MKPYAVTIIIFTIIAGIFLFLLICAVMYKNYFDEFSKDEQEDDEDYQQTIKSLPKDTVFVSSCNTVCPPGRTCFCTCGKSLEERVWCQGKITGKQ